MSKKTRRSPELKADKGVNEDEEYVSVRKRVGGGFKYVNVKVNKQTNGKDVAKMDRNTDGKVKNEDGEKGREKHEHEEAEKLDGLEKSLRDEV